MRGLVPEAIALAGVFVLSLTGPWDTTSTGDSGVSTVPYLAVGLLCGMSFYGGRRQSWGESLAVGAGVGVLGVALYITGSWISYDLGWWGRSCAESGECDPTLLSILPATVTYAIPFAVITAILGGVGHAILGSYWRRAGL